MKYELIEKPRGERIYKLSPLLAKELGSEETITIKSKEEKEFISKLDETIFNHEKTQILDTIDTQEITYHQLEQGSNEWSALRSELVNSSSSIFNKDGNPIPTFLDKVSQKVENYIRNHTKNSSLKEELVRTMPTSLKTELMERGNELETKALDVYQENHPHLIITRGEVIQKGDLLVSLDARATNFDSGKEEILEVKCPTFKKYLLHAHKEVLLKDYYPQIQAQLYVSGLESAKLLVYFPGMKLLETKIERDEKYIINMFKTLELFRKEFNTLLELAKGLEEAKNVQ